MLTRIFARLRAWTRRRDIQNTVDEELQFHVEMEAAARRSRGLSAEDARRTTLADLGGTTQVRDAVFEARTTWLERRFDALRQDLRYSVRTLVRTPIAALSIVLVLAVGVGLNTAIFSAVNAVFFKALPVPDAGDLVYVTGTAGFVDTEMFRNRAAGSIAAFAQTAPEMRVPVAGEGIRLRLNGEWTSANYFTVLGLKPTLGRFFVPADDDPRNTDRGVVISEDLWAQRFDRSPAIIGQRIQLNSAAFNVIGVAPAGFRGIGLPWVPSQFWATRAAFLGAVFPGHADEFIRTSPALIARLAPGATAASVGAALTHIPDRAGHLTTYDAVPAVGLLTPDHKTNFGFLRALAYAALTMAFLVTLIAASNVTGILMARGVGRSTELAVRRAVGATAGRLVQQLLTESAILGGLSGLAGLGVAVLLNRLYVVMSPGRVTLPVDLDFNVLLYTTAVCLAAGLLVGIMPAHQAGRVNVVGNLGDTGAGTPARARRRLRYGVVIPQIALSVALLFVAATHARSVVALELRDPGFRIDDIVSATVIRWSVSSQKPVDQPAESRRAHEFLDQVLTNLRALPGNSNVALMSAEPWALSRIPRRSWMVEAKAGAGVTAGSASGSYVGGDYFRVFDIPILSGRTFDRRDNPSAPLVAIVNSALARELAPDGDILGRRIAQQPADGSPPKWSEVVGVAGDTRPSPDVATGYPVVYMPLAQLASPWVFTLGVRFSADPAPVIGQITRVATALDPRAEVLNARPMREAIAEDRYGRRLALWLLGIAGAIGLVLATIGLYGAVSYWVAQHARDLGVRATLGATDRDIIGLVIRDGAKAVVTALIPGLALGVLALRLTSSLVSFVVGPVPAPSVIVGGGIAILVAAITFVACYLPGRRAAKLDPLVVLRRA